MYGQGSAPAQLIEAGHRRHSSPTPLAQRQPHHGDFLTVAGVLVEKRVSTPNHNRIWLESRPRLGPQQENAVRLDSHCRLHLFHGIW